MFLSILCAFAGSSGVSTGREERPGEYETGPGEADQNARICPQTGEVRSTPLPVHATLFCLFDSLPSCGRFRACRAKHQKLKTGSDQSPGDKKTEAESEQRKFEICHFEPSLLQRLLCFSMQHIFGAFALALLSTNLLLVVPNGPAEPDSEPANQMSWKEGRQLLRK